MGLTVYYDWRVTSDASAARQRVAELHALAGELPFDDVSPIYEQDPPDGRGDFEPYESSFRQGGLYLPRQRCDGVEELVDVPAKHAVFFLVHVEGAESASIGLASHPPVVIHHEDLIEHRSDGSERTRRRGAGDPIEFPTGRRGEYSWHSFCKTQYASAPQLGGEANFLKAHLSLIELLDQIEETGIPVQVRDDSDYADHRDVDRLLDSLRSWNELIAGFVGRLNDMLEDEAGSVAAPIMEWPDFEHLEARGIDEIRRLAKRQQDRRETRD
jgi:hypothetical protein